MTEKQFNSQDENIIKKELKEALNATRPFIFFLIFITLGTFLIPIGFLSRTARRIGEYQTLYEIHGDMAVYITIVICFSVISIVLVYLKIVELFLDKKNKIKIVKEKTILNIIELTEKEKKQWKILNKGYTHQIYVSYDDKFLFDSIKNPELLNVKTKEVQYSKSAEVILNESYS